MQSVSDCCYLSSSHMLAEALTPCRHTSAFDGPQGPSKLSVPAVSCNVQLRLETCRNREDGQPIAIVLQSRRAASMSHNISVGRSQPKSSLLTSVAVRVRHSSLAIVLLTTKIGVGSTTANVDPKESWQSQRHVLGTPSRRYSSTHDFTCQGTYACRHCPL